MRFEFDEGKSRRNLIKHGIDFERAALVFEDPWALTQRDEIHDEEERWITLGRSRPGLCSSWCISRLRRKMGRKSSG